MVTKRSTFGKEKCTPEKILATPMVKKLSNMIARFYFFHIVTKLEAGTVAIRKHCFRGVCPCEI